MHQLAHEGETRKAYYREIEGIKESKEIVFNLQFGGIGDCLVASTLPRLLKEAYDVDFYLWEGSRLVLKNKDLIKLCFEYNPYFKGFKQSKKPFTPKSFQREKSLYSLITDRGLETHLERLERQFKVKGKGVPEIYYEPKLRSELKDIVLIDKNMITGKKFGWKYKENAFEREALRYASKENIHYVDPKAQDLFGYVDSIYSCKRFVATFSGGASIAACFEKPFSVIWPYNAIDGSNYQFCYRKSRGAYVK